MTYMNQSAAVLIGGCANKGTALCGIENIASALGTFANGSWAFAFVKSSNPISLNSDPTAGMFKLK